MFCVIRRLAAKSETCNFGGYFIFKRGKDSSFGVKSPYDSYYSSCSSKVHFPIIISDKLTIELSGVILSWLSAFIRIV